MNAPYTRISLCRLCLLLLHSCVLVSLQAQTIISSRAEHTPGSVDVIFNTTPGKAYRIEHTSDLQNWTFYPETIYGLGQSVSYHVYDAPVPNPAPAPPPSPGEPRPSEFLFFMVTAFSDGSAVAEWRGLDGSSQKGYIASFDLRYQGQIMREIVNGTRVPLSPALPYRLTVWSWIAPKDPSVVNIQPSPGEAATLAKLSSQYQWVYDSMKARVDWRAANPGPPPSPPNLFDDRGQPLRHSFRVREYTTDSNFDRTPDHLQLGAGGNAFNMDLDGDGIPNGYDRDLWPAAQFPVTNALLSDVLIN